MNFFNKMLSFMLKPLVIGLFLIVVLLTFFYVDKDLAIYLHSFKMRDNLAILNWITVLGDGKIYLLIIPIFAIISSYVVGNRTLGLRTWMLWIILLFPCLMAFFLKYLLGRARPILLFEHNLFGFFGYKHTEGFNSFPSGHVTTVTSLVIGIFILFPRYFYLFLIIGIMVALSRVLLTYHYISDVLVSFYLVVLELGLLLYITKRKFPNIYELIFNEKVN